MATTMEFSQLLAGIQDNFSVTKRVRRLRQDITSRRRQQRQPHKTRTCEKEHVTGCKRHLPTGSGPYSVGIVDLMSDPSKNGSFIRFFFPSQTADIYRRESQWPPWLPRKQYGQGYVYFKRINTKVFGRLLNWVAGDFYVPALWHGPLLQGQGRLPVLVFSHGMGGNRTTYSALCCDLASHGFLVAAIEHRDGSASLTYCYDDVNDNCISNTCDEEDVVDEAFPHVTGFTEQWLWYERLEREDDYDVRNRQIYQRVKEVQKVLSLMETLNEGKNVRNFIDVKCQFDLLQFKNRLDLDRLSIVGHSFGGATTVAVLALEPRFKVGVALDSWLYPLDDELYDKVKQPVLLLNTETFQWADNIRDMLKLNVNKDDSLKRVLLTMRGTCHQSHTDFQFMIPHRLGKVMGMRHTMEPKKALDLTAASTRGFLAIHLNIHHLKTYRDLLLAENVNMIQGTNVNLNTT